MNFVPLWISAALAFSSAASADDRADSLRLWLNDVPADASLVALGEAVHGSAGVQEIQYEMFKLLIQERNVRVIVKESGTLASEKISQWLASCRTKVTPTTLDGVYWKTTVDQTFFDWLCRYNFEHAQDPVTVRGIDIWDDPWTWHERLVAVDRKLGLGQAKELAEMGSQCPGFTVRDSAGLAQVISRLKAEKRFPSPMIENCYASLARTKAAIDTRLVSPNLTAKDRYELYWGLLSLSTSLGYHAAMGTRFDGVETEGWNHRDRAQGRNAALIRLQEGETKRMAWIAHTSHTSHNRSDARWWNIGNIRSGIYFFEWITGLRAWNTAITAYHAVGGDEYTLPTAPNSLDRYLKAEGKREAYVSSGAAFLKQYPQWYIQNENRSPGLENGVLLTLADHFDGYYWMSESRKADDAFPAPAPLKVK